MADGEYQEEYTSLECVSISHNCPVENIDSLVSTYHIETLILDFHVVHFLYLQNFVSFRSII